MVVPGFNWGLLYRPSLRLSMNPRNISYQWKVRTVCAPGITSAFVSLANNFQTLCRLPSFPRADLIGTNTARVNWNDGEVGADYEVQYRIRNTNAAYTSATLVTPLGISVTKSFIINDILPGTINEWRVRSIRAPGITSDFTVDPNSFQTLCGPPTQLTVDQLTSTAADSTGLGARPGPATRCSTGVLVLSPGQRPA